MKMPFGVHKGRDLAELPDDYLAWLASIELRAPLKGGVEVEQRRRERDASCDDSPVPWLKEIPAALVPAALDVVRAGLHELAKQHHPDRGGDLRTMQTINAAADALRALLGEGAADQKGRR